MTRIGAIWYIPTRRKAWKPWRMRAICSNARPGLSARMSYEAAYHFTAALFVSGGISLPRTHRGMNSELYRNFVDVGLFPKDVASCLGQLEKDRSTAQYDPIERIELEEAEQDLKKAELFCAAVRELIARQLS